MIEKKDYSTTKMLIKLDGLDSFLDEEGKIRDEFKFQVNNSTFNIHNSKFPSNPDDKFETVLFLPEGEGRKGEGGLRTKGYLKSSYKFVNGDWYICDFKGEIKAKVPDDIRKKIDDYLQSITDQLPSTNNQSQVTNNQSPTTNNQSQITSLPLISVITVVFNGEKYLEQTIQSVINQTYPNVEYIIIDGGSTDGTLNIIKKYEDKIDYWVSEKDRGIYDAMNKGVTVALGNYIIFLNSGDSFISSQILDSNFFDSFDILLGNVKYKSGKIFNSDIDYKIYLKNTIHHQSIFYSISCFKKLGLFNLDFSIMADYHFNFKLYHQNIRIKKIENFITLCSDYGVSDTPRIKNYLEESKIRSIYLNNKFLSCVLTVYSIFRFVLKKTIRYFSI